MAGFLEVLTGFSGRSGELEAHAAEIREAASGLRARDRDAAGRRAEAFEGFAALLRGEFGDGVSS